MEPGRHGVRHTHMRLLSCAVVVTLAVLGAPGCSGAPDIADPSPTRHQDQRHQDQRHRDQRHRGGGSEWRRLPEAPLSPRDHAVVVGVGERMLVVGGWEFLCPPSADCMTPEEPLLDDGAVYDRATDSWRTITPPPFGLVRLDQGTTALGDTAYVLTGCADGPRCAARPRLLSYDLVADRWTDHGRVPGPKHGRHLATLGRTLLLTSASDERGEVADLVFDPRTSAWSELPDDPMPRTFDRFLVSTGDHLVLAGSSIEAVESGESPPRMIARLDLATREWTTLPDAPGRGYQLMPTDDGPLLNGRFVTSPGWILDPATWTWSELPEGTGGRQDLNGVLDRTRATYDIPNSVGETASSMRLVVYDTVAEQLVSVPAPPGREDVYDDSSAALGRDLFVFGGQRWSGTGPGAEGELVADARLWSPPQT